MAACHNFLTDEILNKNRLFFSCWFSRKVSQLPSHEVTLRVVVYAFRHL